MKPANILFDEAGPRLPLRLRRREGARRRTRAPSSPRPARASARRSTWRPSRALGRDVTGAADQYALASTLYEALAGEPPFGRGSVVEILVRKGREDAPPLRRSCPRCPRRARRRSRARSRATRPSASRRAASSRPRSARAWSPRPCPRRARSRVPVFVVVWRLGRACSPRRSWPRARLGLWRPSLLPRPPASAPRGEEPKIMVRLLTPGAEPRRLLRWSPTVGRRQSWRTRSDVHPVVPVGPTARRGSPWPASRSRTTTSS